MKVAYITTIFPPYKGGIGNVAYQHASRLYKKNIDVEVLTVFFSGKESFEFPVKYFKPLIKWGKAGFVPQMFFALNKYDVVELHFPAFGMAEIVWFWKKIFGRKKKLIIFYHHDLVGGGLLGKFFGFYKIFITPLILKSADKILCSSIDYIANSDIENFYQKNKNKFIALPFGVDERFFSGDKEIARQKCGIDQDKKIVLFVGGLDRNHYFKGVDKLISAVAKMSYNNWRLILVGGGELIPDLKKQADNKNISNKVIFAGRQSDEKLPFYYQAADVFVLPSIDRSEAFGIVLLEAMACGSPTVASNLPGVRSVVKEGLTGYLAKPGDVENLGKKIEEILTNCSLQLEFSRNAVHHIADNYQWDKLIEKLIAICKAEQS